MALLGAVSAFALPRTGDAANPKLIATVDGLDTITLEDSGGMAVTSLPAGTYDIEVHDNSNIHNFRLTGPGVDQTTSVVGIETTTWTVTLTAGTYQFICDAHPLTMVGYFTVTGGGTTSGSTSTGSTTIPQTTTTVGTSTQTTTTTTVTVPRRPAPRCVVPSVVGRRLVVARRRLRRSHCRAGRVRLAYTKTMRRGRVLAQRPRAGRRLPAGSKVALVVSRGRRH